jgi:hypothetical protein
MLKKGGDFPMFQLRTDWNPKQARLKAIILRRDRFSETRALLLSMHSTLHTSEVYDTRSETYMDEVWSGVDEQAFRTMPTIKDVTVAWDIWHITRIEDLTANILVSGDSQVLNDDWLRKMKTRVKDTGNAMTDEEINRFSNEVSMDGLKRYRSAVGKRTKKIVENSRQEDMKHRVEKSRLTRILNEGGVIQHKDSIWLMDFWGRKNIAGIFLMPITRHQVVHLNDCQKLKEKCKRTHTN